MSEQQDKLGRPISREELDRIRKMALEYKDPPEPRTGHETIALYDKLANAVMANLGGLLERSALGFRANHSDRALGAGMAIGGCLGFLMGFVACACLVLFSGLLK